MTDLQKELALQKEELDRVEKELSNLRDWGKLVEQKELDSLEYYRDCLQTNISKIERRVKEGKAIATAELMVKRLRAYSPAHDPDQKERFEQIADELEDKIYGIS